MMMCQEQLLMFVEFGTSLYDYAELKLHRFHAVMLSRSCLIHILISAWKFVINLIVEYRLIISTSKHELIGLFSGIVLREKESAEKKYFETLIESGISYARNISIVNVLIRGHGLATTAAFAESKTEGRSGANRAFDLSPIETVLRSMIVLCLLTDQEF